jgi:hypothetical protein
MFGLGRHVPDPTEGMMEVKDLPEPRWAAGTATVTLDLRG